MMPNQQSASPDQISSHHTERELVDLFLRQLSGIVSFDQGACIVAPLLFPIRVAGLANITNIDQSSPYSVWLKKLFRFLDQRGMSGVIDVARLPAHLDGSKYAPGHMIFVPMDLRAGKGLGIFLMRSQMWSDADLQVVEEQVTRLGLQLAFSHRMDLRRYASILTIRRMFFTGVIAGLFLFPVHLATVAPAEVVPLEPSVISSSIAGVVRAVHVRSNEAVVPGQLLVSLDDVDQRNRRDFAQRDLELTRAELKRLEQLGFLDPTQRFRLGELEAQLRIRELELSRANQELARTQIRSERDGIAIVGDAADWAGRPVQIGEKILQIADPSKTALRVFIPAADIPILEVNLQGEVYLDSQPWQALGFRVRHWTFEPELTPTGVIAFRAHGEWNEISSKARLGLRGSAHLEGRMVPLIVYILRRPIILLRQSLAL